jgi:hypothetical protein
VSEAFFLFSGDPERSVCKKKGGHHILHLEARLSINGDNGASGVIGSFYFLELDLYCTRLSNLS